MNELALFAGIGGGILGGKLLGWRTVCAVEIDPYCRKVLQARQDDGTFGEVFPIWDDIRTFDGKPWRGSIDVLTGGWPCQDISTANPAGKGLDGDRSGLWREMARTIREVLPRYVFVENSPNLVSKGLGRVLSDLHQMGFDAEWGVMGADDLGAPHIRKRIWILGVSNAHRVGRGQRPDGISLQNGAPMADAECQRLQGRRSERELGKSSVEKQAGRGCSSEADYRRWWGAQPAVRSMAHGIPFRVQRIRALGNAQVPIVAATAFKYLESRIERRGK